MGLVWEAGVGDWGGSLGWETEVEDWSGRLGWEAAHQDEWLVILL